MSNKIASSTKVHSQFREGLVDCHKCEYYLLYVCVTFSNLLMHLSLNYIINLYYPELVKIKTQDPSL